MDYGCSTCGRCIVKADAALTTRATARCPSCREITELTPLDGAGEILQATYRCTNDGCGRTQRVERPVQERRYCIACGTESLERVRATRRARERRRSAARGTGSGAGVRARSGDQSD